jgi:hypothetical protein
MLFSSVESYFLLLSRKKIVTSIADTSKNSVDTAFISGVTMRRNCPITKAL